MGWMVGDLMRCVDVLLYWPGIDKERIIMLGAVAGGADPAIERNSSSASILGPHGP